MPPTNGGSTTQERARSSSAVDAQEGLFDKQWDDTDLEAALEDREAKREEKLTAKKAFDIADDNAKGLLANYELAVGEVARIGRFRIKRTQAAARHIEFDTDPAPRLSIATEE
jgi:hypothetical protein